MGEISMNYTYEWPWIIDDSIVRCIIVSQIRADIVKQNVLLKMLVSVGSKKRFPFSNIFLKETDDYIPPNYLLHTFWKVNTSIF